MQELNTPFPRCRSGRYHVAPWVMVLPLDEPGEQLLDASAGEIEARAAFFDLSLDGRWGGVISGDKVDDGLRRMCAAADRARRSGPRSCATPTSRAATRSAAPARSTPMCGWCSRASSADAAPVLRPRDWSRATSVRALVAGPRRCVHDAAIDLDQVIAPRSELPPLLDVKLSEIIDFLVETGARARSGSQPPHAGVPGPAGGHQPAPSTGGREPVPERSAPPATASRWSRWSSSNFADPDGRSTAG